MRILFRGPLILLATALLLAQPNYAQIGNLPATASDHDGDSHWFPLFDTYTFQRVTALALYGEEAFLAGPFQLNAAHRETALVRMQPGDVSTNTILKLPAGGWFDALALSDDRLYAGGSFDLADGIRNVAAWERSTESWVPLEAGLDQPIRALSINSGDSLFATANFTRQQTAPWLAEVHLWNGESWTSLGGEFEGFVYDVAVHGTNVFVSLHRQTTGGRVYEVQHWNGQSWTRLALVSGIAYALETDASGRLYAGGLFDAVDGVTAYGVAMWNGNIWSPVGELSEVDRVLALAADEGTLVAGGEFGTADNIKHLMVWDGEAWMPSEGDTNGEIDRLALSGGQVALSGSFDVAGESVAHNAAVYDVASHGWKPMLKEAPGGIRGVVSDLTTDEEGKLYVGGRFATAGAVVARNIAVWDGEAWAALGDGLPAPVHKVHVHRGTLYAARETRSSNDESPALYAWSSEAESWKSVDVQVDGARLVRTYDMITVDENLFVGAEFGEPIGAGTSALVAWDGTNWSIIGESATVTKLAVTEDGALVAGGYFESISGVQAKNIAMWHDGEWSPLGEGTESEVSALAASGSAVYAGTYGPDLHIYRADTEKWEQSRSPIRPQPSCSAGIFALAARGDTVYVGGGASICTVGEGAAETELLARWTPEGWTIPGSGIEGALVRALVLDGNDLYAGGWFDRAGGRTSVHIAHWNEIEHLPVETPSGPAPISLNQSFPNPASSHVIIRFSVEGGPADVQISVYDVLGRQIAVLADRRMQPGTRTVELDVSSLPAGTYVYRLKVGDRSEARRMVVAR